MPTIVGILTFLSRINFVLSWVEHGKSFITLGPDLHYYKQICSFNVSILLTPPPPPPPPPHTHTRFLSSLTYHLLIWPKRIISFRTLKKYFLFCRHKIGSHWPFVYWFCLRDFTLFIFFVTCLWPVVQRNQILRFNMARDKVWPNKCAEHVYHDPHCFPLTPYQDPHCLSFTCFVWFDSLRPVNTLSVILKGRGLPRLNQYVLS